METLYGSTDTERVFDNRCNSMTSCVAKLNYSGMGVLEVEKAFTGEYSEYRPTSKRWRMRKDDSVRRLNDSGRPQRAQFMCRWCHEWHDDKSYKAHLTAEFKGKPMCSKFENTPANEQHYD